MDENTLFKVINDQTEDMVYYYHIASRKYLFRNKHSVNLTGIRKAEGEQVKGKDILLSIHPDDREKVKAAQASSLKPGCSKGEVDYRIMDYRGEYRILHDKWTVERDDSGNPVCILGIARDETDRRQMQEALHESEARYRSLIEISPDGIAVSDLNGKILMANRKLMELHGFDSTEEMIGINGLDIVAPEDRQRAFENGLNTLKSGYWGEIDMTLLRKNGTSFIGSVNASVLLDAAGKPKAFIGVTHDITERKRAEDEKRKLEEQLRLVQKMEAIGQLAGGIAHDFNNILGAVIGYTELALEESSVGDRPRLYLEQIHKAGERARDLVMQILTFSRKQEQKRKPVLVTPIIKEVIKLLRSSLPSTIQITQSVSQTPLMILSDPTQIHQVLMNLCTNAAYALRESGGLLDIQLIQERVAHGRTLHPFNLSVGDYAKLTVRDNGCGIDAAVMDRIYDPFFTTKGPGSGTGLGLSVVYGIVRDHGGAIDIASEPGKGTTVTVHFPLEETERLLPEQAPEQISGGSERILFVDDEAALVELGKVMLMSLGYHVTSRASSIEALEAFRASPHNFDLVITDMTMPNIRGDDLARELLKIRPDIPIILCTGFSEMISEEKAKTLGIRRFVMKPIFKKDIAKVIREILDEG